MNIDKLEQLVCKELKGKGSTHDFSHAKRVLTTARQIADKCGDVEIRLLTAMCLLHDIVRIEGEDVAEPAHMNAERSVELLKECGFDEEDIRNVIDGIKCHTHISLGGKINDRLREPKTIEEKILFDADKIDALGPIGVARWFQSISKKGWDLGLGAKEYMRMTNDFYKMKGRLHTVHGNRLAQKRMEYSMKYMQDLLDHLDDVERGVEKTVRKKKAGRTKK